MNMKNHMKYLFKHNHELPSLLCGSKHQRKPHRIGSPLEQSLVNHSHHFSLPAFTTYNLQTTFVVSWCISARALLVFCS